MNSKFLLLLLSVAGVTSCSTAYRTGQTPDDVYYSPVRPIDDNRDEARDSTYNVKTEEKNSSNTVDVQVYRRSDYDYGYRYPRNRRNRYNNSHVYYDPKTGATKPTVVNTPRKFNPKAYSPDAPSAASDPIKDPKTGKPINTTSSSTNPSRTFGNNSSSSGTTFGNIIRTIIKGDGTDGNSSSGSSKGNTNNNSSSSSSSSSGKSSSSVPVRTFGK